MAAADEDAASEVAADSDGEADGEAAGDDDAPAEDGDGLLNSPAFLKKKIEVLEDELSKMTAERDELAAKLEDEANSPMVLRLQADFENLRRRTTEQMAETVRAPCGARHARPAPDHAPSACPRAATFTLPPCGPCLRRPPHPRSAIWPRSTPSSSFCL